MCDTLCAIGNGRTLFAKNSDRPSTEAQVVEGFAPRNAGGMVRTQYLEISDEGSCSVVGSRPVWLWGFEHGVNEHRVAIGNEAVYTEQDGTSRDPALIGMDLVRLGLERGRTAAEAVDVMTALLETHGQGGDCYESGGTYSSSFLVADPHEAWLLETGGRTWAAKRFDSGAAISNRISLRDDWDLASADVEPGGDFDRFRHPEVGTRFADVRLAASRACLARGASALAPRDLAAHLRHHGERPWGAPGADVFDVSGLPERGAGDAAFTICMHVRGAATTNAGMVCELPDSPARPLRAWVALGSPCASVFVPIFPPEGVPGCLSDEKTWRRFAALRDRVESDASALAAIRSVLGPLEAELWAGADTAAGDERAQRDFVESIGVRIDEALDRLA